MRIVNSIPDFPTDPTKRTGFVPTMGALHDGHLSLIRRSRDENDRTVVSIYVNPTQFGPNEDFTKYPRPLNRDCELAASAGADIVFAPDHTTMYSEHPSMIHVPFVTDLYEGEVRPGHFSGVATIVSKLFNIVSPKNVYFGEKDLQQCALIRKMVSDLNYSINVIICETSRESSGLAKSSRNIFLSDQELENAPTIFKTLNEAKYALIEGELSSTVKTRSINHLIKSGFIVDYFDLVNRLTMHPILEINDQASLIVAVKLGSTRLIDNVRVIG